MSILLSSADLKLFKNLLEDYQPDSSVLEQFQKSNFAIIAGPAGAGKDTLRNALTKESDTYMSVLSATTRPPRHGEENGKDYYFRSHKEIEKDLKAKKYFQAALVHKQQISGVHVEEIEKLSKNQMGLSILIVQAEEKLRLIKPDIKTIFLIPPDFETLKARMQSERILSTDEVNRRLAAAENELKIALKRQDYYCLVSEAVTRTAMLADDFLRKSQRDSQADQKARKTIQSILNTLSK